MTLAGVGYQAALVRELACLDVCLAGISEARIPGNGCQQVEDALILHSGGNQRMYSVALVHPPINHSLVKWHAISDRLLLAQFTYKHGHLAVVVAYAPTELTAQGFFEGQTTINYYHLPFIPYHHTIL